MVHYLVRRATSNMLFGPDWAMNAGICDLLNRDPSQSKDVVRGIKNRIKRKNPKVQILALTLLDTIVRNCGDIVHMHVAEKEVLRDMVKILRKRKPDIRVKEKILILIDTWQEAFGGPRARYPQFYAAYQELLHMGCVFPQRSESSAPIFSPHQNSSNPDKHQGAAECSEPEFPTLSSTEIQNARGVMNVLAEMLNALDPGNKEGLRQEAIVDLVEQCRTYKGRLVHLVNSTSDESLLCEGLALNDELQRVLSKFEAIASGGSAQTQKPKSEPDRSLIDVDAPLIDTGDGNQNEQGSTMDSSAGTGLLTDPPSCTGQSTTVANTETKVDLLSGDNFGLPTDENQLAIVPAGSPQPDSPVSPQNSLALVEMPSQNNHAKSTFSAEQAYPSPGFQDQNFQSAQATLYSNGSFLNMFPPQYVQAPYIQGSDPAWNAHIPQQQQLYKDYGAQSGGSLPPPPWEAQTVDGSHAANSQALVIHSLPANSQAALVVQSLPLSSGVNLQGSPTARNGQPVGMYVQSGSNPISAFDKQTAQNSQPVNANVQPIQGEHCTGMFPQPIQHGQMAYVHPQQMYGNQMLGYGHGYDQQQHVHFLEQRMPGLSVRDDGGMWNSMYQLSSASYMPAAGRPSKPDDKLFGDLVDIAKSRKQNS